MMIRKLQRKFILITGLAVVLMMVCFLLPVNTLNHYRVGQKLRRTLSYIIEKDEKLPYGQPEPESEYGLVAWWETVFGSDAVSFTPESRYQLRYFLVWLDEEGNEADISLSHIASVDKAAAVEQARSVLGMHRQHGYLRTDAGDYYFLKTEEGDGHTVVGFLDCSRELDSLSLFYYSSIGFAFLMVVVLLIIIAFLSRRAMQPYVDNMESQREFITNAGHELKTPFAIISANTEVLEMLNGKNEWTESILSQVARGTSLINDLITLSRTTEAAEIVLTDVDLSEVTAQSAQSFRTVIEQQGKHLECGIEEQVTVKGEQKLLTELVNILVDNAAKYCDENGTVRVVLKKRGRSGAQLMVSNDFRDGSQEECSHYFQRFYRGDTSHNSGKSGYGIGLSMAQSVTERLKGKISAGWKKGVITFTVVF